MGNLADFIEKYLRNILEEKQIVELQRRELARLFRCAPSQINYVLETRFTLERGYVIESKRGGGGYIRISQVHWRQNESLPELLEEIIPEFLTEEESLQVFSLLIQKGLVDPVEAQLAVQATNNAFVGLSQDQANLLRAKMVKAMLLVLGSRGELDV